MRKKAGYNLRPAMMTDSHKESRWRPPADGLEPTAGFVDEPARRWWIWLVYTLLFGASIPWYLPPDSTPRIWLGLPHWVVISLLATIGIALFTVVVVNRYWREAEPPASLADKENNPL